AQAEIDIFQIRFESLVENADLVEDLGAEERCCPGGGEDAARLREGRTVRLAVPRAPAGPASTRKVERCIDEAMATGIQDLAGGKPCGISSQSLKVVGG